MKGSHIQWGIILMFPFFITVQWDNSKREPMGAEHTMNNENPYKGLPPLELGDSHIWTITKCSNE